ncbi:MAG: efflux RND transporter periplasmic adaptor subunit [Spirochaetia bacterium]
MKRRLKVAIALFVTLPVLIIGVQIVRKVGISNDRPERVSAVPVIVGEPAFGDLENSILYPGTLTPDKTVIVLPKTAGKLEQIYVTEGERVHTAHLLASVEKRTYKLQVEQALAAYQAAEAQYRKVVKGVRPEELDNARALLHQAESDLETAERNLERSRNLVDAGALARSAFEEIEMKYSNARTRVENARRSLGLMEQGAGEEDLEMARANAGAMKAQYELSLIQLENTDITAPVDGLVARILAEEGSTVSQQVPLLALVQDDPMYVEVQVPERHFAALTSREGTIPCRIYPQAFPGTDGFFGTVTNISRIVEAESRTFALEIAVENPGGKLRPGMYVNVEIVLERSADALLVPESALVFRDDEYVVFTVESGSPFEAVMRPVSVGLRKNGAAEIIEGLTGAERIIIRGNAFLEDGQPVESVAGP